MKKRLVKEAEKISGSIIEFWPVAEGKVPEVQSLSDVLMQPVKKEMHSIRYLQNYPLICYLPG